MHLHLESNLRIQYWVLAECFDVILQKGFEKSCPLISIGCPVKSMVKLFGKVFFRPFWSRRVPDIRKAYYCSVDVEIVFQLGDESFKEDLACYIGNFPVVFRINESYWLLFSASN